MAELFAGRYEPIDVIGKGATGSVWRVLDHREGKMIAAKLLRQSDKTSLLRFVMEQAVRIHHPHVLSPLGWAAEDDRVILTMPLADGGSVGTLMADMRGLCRRASSPRCCGNCCVPSVRSTRATSCTAT